MGTWRQVGLPAMGLLASIFALLLPAAEVGAYWLQPFALLPYFWASRGSSRCFCFGGAALLGGVWASPLLFAVMPRSWMLALFFAGATGAIFALLLVLAVILVRPVSVRLCAFGGLWGLAASWSEAMALPLRPWPLHGEFVLQVPEMWPAVALVGWPNVDAMILIAVGLTWSLIECRTTSVSWLPRGIRWIGLIVLSLILFMSPRPFGLKKVGVASIGVVQANLGWNRLRAVGSSPIVRAEVQERLEGLTRQAIQAGGQLIVWPENGAGVATGQIPSLVAHYRELLAPLSRTSFEVNSDHLKRARRIGGTKDDVEIIVAGDQRGPQGARATAWLLGEHGVRASVQKQIPVPWFETWEQRTTSNESIVMETAVGPAGVLLCYDGVHRSLVKRALDFGAEFLLTPTDNASFYASGLEREQFVSSAMLAIESGRALVSIVNRGASQFIDPHELRYDTLVGRDLSAARVIQVSRMRGTTLAMHGGRLVAGFGWIVVLLGMMAVRCHRTRHGSLLEMRDLDLDISKISFKLHRVFSFVLCVHLCGFAGIVFAGVYHRHFGGRFHPETSQWIAEEQPFNGADLVNSRDLAGLFRQREPFRCGPSALAFALFILGDTVFPETLDAENPGPFSLAELYDLARSRGIHAEMFQALPSRLHISAGRVLLLHLQYDHYVAIFRDNEGKTIRFDPADGSMIVVQLSELDDWASGYGMELQLKASRILD